jgi:hypothetical protein
MTDMYTYKFMFSTFFHEFPILFEKNTSKNRRINRCFYDFMIWWKIYLTSEGFQLVQTNYGTQNRNSFFKYLI